MKKQFTISLIMFFTLGLFPIDFSNAANIATRLKGKILLQVESVGQAWYIDPITEKRAFLGRPADAFRIMRELGLGISEKDYNSFNGYAPNRLSGKILLRVEANGEAYYVFPDDLKMHYLGRPVDAFNVMRGQGLGITNSDLTNIPVSEKYKEQTNTTNTNTTNNEQPNLITNDENFRENLIMEYAKTAKTLENYTNFVESYKPIYNERINKINSRIGTLKNTKLTTTWSNAQSYNNTAITFNSIIDGYIDMHEDDINNINIVIKYSDANG